MAEPYVYSREDVTDDNGNVVGTALFRSVRGEGGVPGEPEFRGTRGRIRNYERSAAARGAARNPSYNLNYRR